jgi:uncharacterized protein (TIGR00299 family) protein
VSQRILHLDAFSGAAGNMFLGALLDLGLSRKALQEALAPLGLDYRLVVKRVKRNGFAARYVDVRVPVPAKRRRAEARVHAKAGAAHAHDHAEAHGHAHHGRHYTEIHDRIAGAALAPAIQQRALAIFEALGRAEAKVHGVALEDVHFHEVGAVDAIVDVCGAAAGLALLGVDRVTCSAIAIGHGSIESDHGRIPVPAPATLELLVGLPTVPAHVAWETITPTGAAILKTIVDDFVPMPAITVERVGYGAGNDRPGPMPNVLRATLGRGASLSGDRVVGLETNLDDLVPEHFDYLMERLFEAGALDVSLQSLQMKKNRPGFLVRVLGRPSDRDALARILFAESTAIGVRVAEWDRIVLERSSRRLKSSLGVVSVKCIRTPEGDLELSPEYDDCRKLARRHGLPLRQVVERVRAEAREAWSE